MLSPQVTVTLRAAHVEGLNLLAEKFKVDGEVQSAGQTLRALIRLYAENVVTIRHLSTVAQLANTPLPRLPHGVKPGTLKALRFGTRPANVPVSMTLPTDLRRALDSLALPLKGNRSRACQLLALHAIESRPWLKAAMAKHWDKTYTHRLSK